MSAQGEGICVGIRMRPLNDREKSSGQDKIFQVERNSVAQIHHGQVVDNQVYNYDKVFNESATTSEVYRHIAKDIVTGVLNGINGTIFACKFILILQFCNPSTYFYIISLFLYL